MTRTRSLALTLCLLVGPTLLFAEPGRDHDIVPEDYFTLSAATGIAQSPGGAYVAYTEMRWDEEENTRNTDLWVVAVSSGKVTRLTFDPAADTSPRWGPDEKWVYFLSSRKREDGEKPPYNGEKQVWRVSPSGGEIFPVTRLPEGVDQFELSHDGATLYFAAGVEHVDEDEWEELRKEFKDLKYGHGVTEFSELWALDLETWRSRRLFDERRVIVDFAVSPDERRIGLITRPDETLLTNEGWSTVEIYDARSGEITTLPDRKWREEAPSPYGWLLQPVWSDDGDVFAFRVDFDGYPGEVLFAHFNEDGLDTIDRMTRPGEVSAEGTMAWMPGSRTFCFVAEDRARVRVYGVPEVRPGGHGKGYALTPGDVVVDDFSFSRKRDPVAVLMSGLDHPDDVFLVRKPGSRARYERLTRLNPQVDTWKIPQIQIVEWTSPDGTPVEGILELPPGHTPGDRPLPLVVVIHGGPSASTKYRFRFWIYGRTLFASQGWAMLSPNYRGSTGYGDTFLTDLVGHKNDRDVADILSGVDALIERGIADPERMAVMGWSNGGYLTNCIITRDQRFKAASSGAGVFDTVMQWSIEDTPGHVINFNRGLPWEQEAAMRETSPLFRADRIRTPTVIHVGENDPRVPQEHSRSLYRALKHYLDVPVELIVYPGEGHGLTKYTHRRAKINWDLKWFNRHVMGEPGREME